MLRRELVSFMIVATLMQSVNCALEEGIPEVVNRRSLLDIYSLYDSGGAISCSEGNNSTYIVDERRCVDQQQLLNACSFSIAPSDEFLNPTITLAITRANLLMTAATFTSNSMLTNAVLVYRGTNQPVNGSLCYISNLEVYRGRNQITVIESDGFSLNESGFIEIDNTSLAYSPDEYLGELYRMNLSCSGGGLPESGCLFFKVLGRTNVTSAKFDDRVPGTIYGREEDDPTTTMFISTTSTESTTDSDSLASTTQQPTLPPTTQTSRSNTTNATSGVNNTALMYAIYIIAAVGVVALLVVVVLLCAVIAFLCCSSSHKHRRKREPVTLTDLQTETESSDLTATAPKDIPITQQALPPPPEWNPDPKYNVPEASASWMEGSDL